MRQSYILIVDDDAALLEALSQMLRLRVSGMVVDTASLPSVTLERISSREYDAIIADIRMPEIDGLELLAESRKRFQDIPVLLITGQRECELVVICLSGCFSRPQAVV